MALTEAAVGAVLGELLKAILEIKGKIEEYNSILKRIETTLNQIEPIVKVIDDLNGKLDRKGEQTKLLWEEIKRGKDLIHCCKNEIGGCCSCIQKPQYRYLGRLQELDKSLSSFYNIVVSLHTLREVIQTRETVEIVRDTMDSNHECLMERIDRRFENLVKLLGKSTTNNSAADASNISQRQGNSQARPSGYASGDETRAASSSAPVRAPERSLTPVPDQRKQVPGEYGRANSKGRDGDAATSIGTTAVPAIPARRKETPGSNGSLPSGFTAAAPKEYAPPSPVPQASGFVQVRPNLEEDGHQDQTKRATTTAHNVWPSHPSPPPKSPEVVRETRRNGPPQILPHQAMDSPWQQPHHAQPEPRQVKQVPDKPKEVPREPAYSTRDGPAQILPYQVMDSPWHQPHHAQPEPRQVKQVPDKPKEVPREPAYSTRDGPAQILPYQAMDSPRHQPHHAQPELRQVKQVPERPKEVPREPAHSNSPDNKSAKPAISPVASNDTTRDAFPRKDSPSGRYSSYPVKPAGPATSNHGFGIPPETRAISPSQDQYRNTAPPPPTTTANPAPSRPYIPHDSPSSGKDTNPKGQPHSNSGPKTTERSPGNFAPYPQPGSAPPPKPRETITTSFVKDLSGYSSPSQSGQPKIKGVDHHGQGAIVGTVGGSSYASLANKASPITKAPEVKKGGGGEEWRRYKSGDNRDDRSSDENDE